MPFDDWNQEDSPAPDRDQTEILKAIIPLETTKHQKFYLFYQYLLEESSAV